MGLREVFFLDTTLRDGAQMPGAALDSDAKVAIARALDEAGVHAIEAGYAASGPLDVIALRAVASATKSAMIASLARAHRPDVDVAADALADVSPYRRLLNLFLPTSPIHRATTLNVGRNALVDRAVAEISYAREQFKLVGFAAEDAGRTELPFLCELFRNAIDAGATSVCFTDTVGLLTPAKVRDSLLRIREHVPNLDRALLAVHLHNDLGLATANTLAAVAAGAQVVNCTVNGIGERAGNAALEEVALSLSLHAAEFGVKVHVDTTRFRRLSTLVAEATGIPVSPNKPIVGANAFATEAGIHQSALLKDARTYLPYDPVLVGGNGAELTLGRYSGRAAVRTELQRRGLEVADAELDVVMRLLKQAPKDVWSDPDALLDDAVARARTNGDSHV
jgi:2-isopropylmalate synthase